MKHALIFLVLPLLAGCAHTVNYKLAEKDRWTGPGISGVVSVQPFVDRSAVITNEVEQEKEGDWRTNYRKGYHTNDLSGEVTAMIAKHLAYSGLFSKVVSGKETNADYFLAGSLADFETHGRANKTAETIVITSGLFGGVGVIIALASTSGMKSEIKTSVTLDGLTLTDKSRRVLWRDSITISKDAPMYFGDADQVSIFNQPDQALKEAVNELVHRLGSCSLTNQPVSASR